ncbi:hypothetical protein OG394_10885 [Kribbella sp. NBC_01245]|uniref:hypothetical protein n=1 Tax=Kribbella sp. NBC_01245 TaxID=2903578 RepID=UPI002E285633|nr:hypothetical protein [Kribbella sp. NBC_01245]
MSTVFSQARARVANLQPGVGKPAPKTKTPPRLRVVHGAPFRPPRMPFVLFVVALLAGGLIGLLLLNTELQRGTFQITSLQAETSQLRDNQEALERQVRTLESPQNLADRALRMGMVPNPNPVFLRLSDGKVLGVPAEGKAGTGTQMFVQLPPVKPIDRPGVQPTQQIIQPSTPVNQTTKPPIKPNGQQNQAARTTTSNGG